MKPFLIFVFIATAMLLSSCGTKPIEAPAAPVAATKEAEPALKPYPFDNCAVSRQKLSNSKKVYTREHQGYEIKFCCTPCLKAFEMNPEIVMPRIREYYAAENAVAKTAPTTPAPVTY
ncbi:MAG: hypothetical protein AAF226_02100 [Verrucomicrobiota bacterium]